MNVDSYYEFANGNKFKVVVIKNGLCHCQVVDRYEHFYMTILDGNQKLFDDEIKEIQKTE